MGVIAVVLAGLLLTGCSLVSSAFTKPTGRITIERQSFINTYALLKVLTIRMLADADAACDSRIWPIHTCEQLKDTKRELQRLDLSIQAKIEVPESEIDWAVVMKVIGALASLRP